MSKDSKPLLFIDTVSQMKESKDILRANKVYLNRLDDIKAMLYYKIDILIEVKMKNTLIEGVVKSVDESGLKLIVNNQEKTISLNEIDNINILRL